MATKPVTKPKDTGRNEWGALASLGAFVLDPTRIQTAINLMRSQVACWENAPESLAEVSSHIGKPIAEWADTEYRLAVELLGHWVDALRSGVEYERALRAAMVAPKKRGRKPKLQTQLAKGLLSGGYWPP